MAHRLLCGLSVQVQLALRLGHQYYHFEATEFTPKLALTIQSYVQRHGHHYGAAQMQPT